MWNYISNSSAGGKGELIVILLDDTNKELMSKLLHKKMEKINIKQIKRAQIVWNKGFIAGLLKQLIYYD